VAKINSKQRFFKRQKRMFFVFFTGFFNISRPNKVGNVSKACLKVVFGRCQNQNWPKLAKSQIFTISVSLCAKMCSVNKVAGKNPVLCQFFVLFLALTVTFFVFLT
jgi:hypothetical protein